MTNMPLRGLRILIVEDDYYQASDTRAMIEEAGGRVIGPFSTAVHARHARQAGGADIAVVDINLGSGPAFELARHLSSVKLPFLFATGYDQETVPDDLKAIVRLEKPFSAADLVHAAATLKCNGQCV